MCDGCRQAVEVLVRDVLPSVLDLIPEDLEPGFKLHVAGGSRVPDGLAALLQQNKEAVTVHVHLTEEQVQGMQHGMVPCSSKPCSMGAHSAGSRKC